MAMDIANLTMDNNYLSIEEYVGEDEEDLERASLQALAHLYDNEVYDIYPSISNVTGWENMVGKRGADTQPRWTLSRFLAE